MNQKKCPKCGENNPAEAVMCWACYTPLSGGAGAAAAASPAGMAPKAGGGKAAKDTGGDKEKKPIEPWQMGVLGVALVVGLGFGGYTLFGGGGAATEEGTNDAPAGGTKSGNNTGPAAPQPPSPSTPGGTTTQPSSGGGSVPTVDNVPFVTICAPSAKTSVAIMGIMPRTPPVNGPTAAGIAAFARSQFIGVKRWDEIYIFVFNDTQAAQFFSQYQSRRGQQPLTSEDYQRLSQLWPQTPVRYYYRPKDRKEGLAYPSKDPYGNWWSGKTPPVGPQA